MNKELPELSVSIHRRLTFKYQGLDMRFTGAEEAHVLKDILA